MEDCKIKTTCDELDQFLSSLSQSNIPSPDVLHASPTTSDIHHHGDILAIVSSTNTEAYRCKCYFQIVEDVNENLACVIRENGTIYHLPDGIFPPANFRIREAMKCLINLLNKRSDHTFIRLRENLTSVTFDTSWDEKECLLTLHYGPPGISQSCCEEWKQEAQIVCDECQFVRVTGRSKGIKLFVSESKYTSPVADANDPILEEGIIQDTLWLILQKS